jgi:hypothetical protein
MPDMFGALVSVGTMLLPHGLVRLRKHLKVDRHVRKFWRKTLSGGVTLVLPPRENDPQISGQQIHSYIGLLEFLEGIQELHPAYTRARADVITESDLRRVLLSVTGPIPNRVTQHLLARPEVHYTFDDHTIVSRGAGGLSFAPEMRTSDFPSRDYGIITRMKNPYDDTKDAVIACGCWGWGTQAVLRSLVDPSCLQKLNSVKARYVQAVCTCEIDDNGVAQRPILLDIHPDPSMRVSTIVELT